MDCSPTGMLEGVGAGVERYMNLLSARQKLVASNIANADTPGFKTKDIDFQAELASQMSGTQSPNPIEVAGLKTKNDGNNVSLDREARLLAENNLRFTLASVLVRGHLQLIKSAISEGKTTA